jgi:Pyruvate/2-oxoacid:ferredoxin oxidoreductase delta subunit
MKSKVYCFSSTGNSLQAARLLSRGLGAGEPESIAAGETEIDREAEAIGIVFPVYLHEAPAIVLDFLRRSVFPRGAYAFAVATNNGECGSCMRGVDAALRRGGASLAAGFSLLMPGNSVILADLTNGPEERSRRIAQSEESLRGIVEAVLSGEKNEFGRREEWVSWAKSRFYRIVMSAYGVPRHFHAGEACSRCGACARVCPRANIEIRGEGPRWGKACEGCLGCYHACPRSAIDLDGYTKGALRYRHPAVALEELFLR